MKIVHNSSKLNIDSNKEVYQCLTCYKLFNWTKNSSWYGSYNQMENKPEKIKYFCSDKCVRINKL